MIAIGYRKSEMAAKTISMVACPLTSSATVTCSDTKMPVIDFKCQKCFIGLASLSQLAVVDYDDETDGKVSIYSLNGQFGSPGFINWLHPDTYIHGIRFQDMKDTWVRSYQGNRDHAVVHFTSPSGVETGYLQLDFVQGTSLTGLDYDEEGLTGVFIADTFVKFSTSLVSLYRISPSVWLKIDASELSTEMSPYTLRVGALYNKQDALAYVTMSVVDPANTPVVFDTSSTKGLYLDVYNGTALMLPFDRSDIVSGNNLDFSASSPDSSVELTARMNDDIEFKFVGEPAEGIKFDKVVFARNFGFRQEYSSGLLYVYECKRLTSFKTMTRTCVYKGELEVDVNMQLQDDVTFNDGYAAIWTLNPKEGTTTLHVVTLLDGESVQIYSSNLFDIAADSVDMAVSDESGSFIFAVVNSAAKRVEVLQFELFTERFTTKDKYTHVTMDTVHATEFCPSRAHFNPLKFWEVAVLSNCDDESRIYNINLAIMIKGLAPSSGTGVYIFHSSIPLSQKYSVSNFCNFGQELVIEAQLKTADASTKKSIYGIDNANTLSLYNILLEGGDIKHVNGLNCIKGEMFFSVFGDDGNGNSVVTIISAKNERDAAKRIFSVRKGKGETHVGSFAEHNSMIHVSESEVEGKTVTSYSMTYLNGPLVLADFSKFTGKLENLDITLHGKNKGTAELKDSKVFTVEVKHPNTETKVTYGGERATFNTTYGLLDLESSSKITGPLYTAQIQPNKTNMRLRQRLERVADYKPPKDGAVNFAKIVKSDDGSIVGLSYGSNQHGATSELVLMDSNMKYITSEVLNERIYDFDVTEITDGDFKKDSNAVDNVAHFVIYSSKHPAGGFKFEALVLTTDKVTWSQSISIKSQNHNFSKMKMVRTTTTLSSNYGLAAYSHFDGTLAFYEISLKVATYRINIDFRMEHTISTNAKDFDIVFKPKGKLVTYDQYAIYYIERDAISFMTYTYEANQNVQRTTNIRTMSSDEKHQYVLISISVATMATGETERVVCDAFGTSLVHFVAQVWSKDGDKSVSTLMLEKYLDFEGFEIQVSNNTVAQLATRMNTIPRESAILTWKLDSKDATSIHAAVPTLNAKDLTSPSENVHPAKPATTFLLYEDAEQMDTRMLVSSP